MSKNYPIKSLMLGVLTACGLSVSAQYTETFDNTTMPVGWSNTSSTGSTSTNALWKFDGDPDYAMSGTSDHTGNGGSYAWVDGSTPNNLTSILETDNVNMTGVVNPELRFWLKSDITGYNTTFNTFSVDVFDGATWHTGAFTFANNTANQDWEQFSVSLSAYTFSGPAKFRFNVDQTGGTPYWNDIALDDVEIFSDLVNNAGLTAVLNPELPGCTLDSVVTVELKNYGSGNLTSAQINWSINGNLQMPYSWTGSLATSDLDTVTVGTNSNIAFGDIIDVWTSMPNGIMDSAAYNDSTQLEYIQGYSGVMTIDPSGAGDFVSFTDAINNIDIYGVCGSLIVEAVNGTYVEQLNLSTFPGMSSMNTLTFRSQSGNADSVIISYSATGSADNYILNFDEASYITIANMTLQNLGADYSRVVTTPTSGGNTNITIDGCKWVGMPSTSTWDSDEYVSYIYGPGNDNWTIVNNTIMNGNYGLYLYGNFSANGKNNIVENNEFMDQYYRSAYFYYQEDGMFTGNHATSNTTYNSGYSFYIGQTLRTEISNNHIEGNANWPRYGLYLTSVTGDLNTFLPVYNNRIIMPKSSGYYGIYASSCLFVEVAHNSVYMNSSSTSYGALYFTGGSFNTVKNNIFINGGSGAAVYMSGSGIYEMDYNNLSAPNGGNIGYNGSNQATLTDWVAATQLDSNSVNVNNVMSDTASFKVCNDSLWNVGTAMPMYAVDYEGDVRQDPPCIGADEFMPISQFGFTNSPVLCSGDTLTLVQDYFDTVVWNTTDTSNTYDITAPGTQQVAVYDLCGSDTSVFTVMPQQVATVGDTNLCEGTSATLNTGISGGTYMWSNDLNADTSTDSVVVVDTAMTVYVEVVDMHGCSSMDTAVVTQSMDVVLDDSASFCEGANVVLDANMQGTYLWSDGSTNQTLSVTSPGSYSVTVTDQNCVSSASSYVSEILDAVASFSDSSSFYTVVFTNASQNGTSYLWEFGDGTTSTEENPTHIYPWTNEDSICYVVKLTVTNSCGSHTYTNDCVRVGQLVSVSEVELASLISVYPNPNAGIFTVNVKSDEAKEMSVQVLDIRGAQVFVQSYGKVNGEVNRTINLEGAAQGIYFVKVTLDGETAVYRVSVK
ncbi:right-handed parallel beta-helix repeat-containing protein [bacterium SCSIO 12643]|nr:right-handed parallel beta-helix repeat-containing protein [bacterium SCSIO 12643]